MTKADFPIDLAFLQNVAHQLVAPLQSIEGQIMNIIEGNLDHETERRRLTEAIGHIRITTELARRIEFLYQLVDPSAPRTTGSGDCEQTPFGSIVSQFLDSYNNYLVRLQERGILLDIDTKHLNAMPMVGSWRLATQQVIMNLFDNAAKYAKGGSSIVVDGKIKGDFVVIRFQTISAAIATGERERIFERGFRGGAVKDKVAAGTGVGLWISRQLMRAMKGDICCEPGGAGKPNVFLISWKRVPKRDSRIDT